MAPLLAAGLSDMTEPPHIVVPDAREKTEEADHRYPRLLRADSDRPSCRDAEKTRVISFAAPKAGDQARYNSNRTAHVSPGCDVDNF